MRAASDASASSPPPPFITPAAAALENRSLVSRPLISHPAALMDAISRRRQGPFIDLWPLLLEREYERLFDFE